MCGRFTLFAKLEKLKAEFELNDVSSLPYSYNLAGIYDYWPDGEETAEIVSAAIITTDANSLLKPYHSRMPVIIESHHYNHWLDPENKNTEELRATLYPREYDNLTCHAVSQYVNAPKNNDNQCIKPS